MKTFFFALVVAFIAAEGLAIPMKQARDESLSSLLYSRIDPLKRQGTATTTTSTNTGSANDDTFALAARNTEIQGLGAYGNPKKYEKYHHKHHHHKHYYHSRDVQVIPDNDVFSIPDSDLEAPNGTEVPNDTEIPDGTEVDNTAPSGPGSDASGVTNVDSANNEDDTQDDDDNQDDTQDDAQDDNEDDNQDDNQDDTDDDTVDDGSNVDALGHREVEAEAYDHRNKHWWHKHHHHYRAIEGAEGEQIDSYYRRPHHKHHNKY